MDDRWSRVAVAVPLCELYKLWVGTGPLCSLDLVLVCFPLASFVELYVFLSPFGVGPAAALHIFVIVIIRRVSNVVQCGRTAWKTPVHEYLGPVKSA